jgi:hypothetical protein
VVCVVLRPQGLTGTLGRVCLAAAARPLCAGAPGERGALQQHGDRDGPLQRLVKIYRDDRQLPERSVLVVVVCRARAAHRASWWLTPLALSRAPSPPAGQKLLVPMTQSIFIPGKLAETTTVMVEIGTGFFVKRPLDDAKKFCERNVSAARNEPTRPLAFSFHRADPLPDCPSCNKPR